MPGVLDARVRDESLRKMAAEPLDVLVIGGGITGAGAALDAASRGLRVGLVESRDLAAGTSSRSSKLIHGGLRYLEQGDFKLVREALRERDLLVSRLAPHLVRPVPFLYPLYRKVVERPYVGAGLVLYDAMEGTRRPVPHHRHLTTRGALRRAPALRPDRLAGAMVYYDAQVDDARYTVTVARTASRYGALVVTRATAISLLRDGARVTGATVRDEESGWDFDVHASRVIVCAGVWSDLVHSASGVRAGYQVRMSKGVHLVMPRSAIDAETGMIVRTSKSVLFFIPWGSRWIVGTTDTDWSGDRAEPTATAEDVDYILGEANRVLATPLTRGDVLAVYAGLRPLVAEPDKPANDKAGNGEKPTTKLSREHVVDSPLPGLTSIAGGKFTTYRLMARDVVDAAVEGLPGQVSPSVTGQLPLLGADGLPAILASARRLAEDYAVPLAAIEHLIARYGSAASEILDAIRADRGLRRPLVDGYPYLRAEVSHAVTHEGALHVEDVLARRVRLLIESSDAGASAAPEVAAIMGGLLGWSRRRRTAEIRRYLDFAAANTAALSAPAIPAVAAAVLADSSDEVSVPA
ncbi:glycerol-3-phosphate dehydrogenase/oxidase [Trebonia kvetii]|uniref:Glycerol-3-phosphate dehydrogenase n=1 Tax=Trebonia kvetii TaxID=2480626 RepID=A0A6P2C3S7_9ACTN|nr:glycerol-3-phosphate dehydrogenase/oxidase [Trebonia kvetii]TVZ06034.1 glycerol-3-phosphate dehydrogenase/oxidase [Trebonia kvetii]